MGVFDIDHELKYTQSDIDIRDMRIRQLEIELDYMNTERVRAEQKCEELKRKVDLYSNMCDHTYNSVIDKYKKEIETNSYSTIYKLMMP